MAVVASATGAAVFGLSGVAAGLAGGALLGAGAGALYSGITGDGNILNSALTGGLIGGAVGGLGAAFGPGLMGAEAAGGAGALGAASGAGGAGSAAAGGAGAAGNLSPALAAATGANTTAGAALANASADPILAAANLSGMTAPQIAAASVPATVPSAMSALSAAAPMTGNEMLGYGLAGTAAMSLLGGMNQPKLSTSTGVTNPSEIRPYTYGSTTNQSAFPTGPQYGPNGLPILPGAEKSFFNQTYTAGTPYTAADGGLMSVPVPGMMQSGPANVNFMGTDMYPTSQQQRSYYATPTQMPTSAQASLASYEPRTNPLTGEPMRNMARGGEVDGGYNLGGYSDGGRLLKGPGDGVSDDIPAVIGEKQPARLADGEFVIPARIVSELGNGSTDAGAKRLYAMMDNIQAGRKKTVGKGNVAKDTKAKKHLLA